MFNKRWSNSVALPFGPQWGDPENGKGGVAACMVWSRKDDPNRRPATTSGMSRRPPAGPGATKSSLKITGKGFSFRPERDREEHRSLNEKDVVEAVHRASRQSVARRPASATGATNRMWRPFNPTPPPSQRKMFQKNSSRNDIKRRPESPEEVTGWTYKFKEKNIYDLYDTDAFYSPSTPSRSNSAAGYVPSPDAMAYAERRSRNDYRSPQQVGNETEFVVHTKGSQAIRNSPQNVTDRRVQTIRKGKVNEAKDTATNDSKYENLSKELDRAIKTIRDLTRFQRETLGLYQNTNPTFATTYDREFSKPKNGITNGYYHGYRPQSAWETGPTNSYHGYKPQPPSNRLAIQGKRDFVKENARPQIGPREAWGSLAVPMNQDKVHTVRGPNGLMTIRVDCGDKPLKNVTVRVLDDKKAPQVILDH